MQNARMLLKLSAFALFGLVLMPLQMLALRLDWALAHRIPVLFHRAALAALGVRVTVKGAPSAERPLMLLANHGSWLDILVLGSILPVGFIAKSEVAGWPVFGTLARLQRTVFVERDRRGRTGEQAAAIAARLSNGDAMVLFAEGTTSDGSQVLPFRSSLLGAARAAIDAGGHAHVMVQPVAIGYTGLHGMPAGRTWRRKISWMGDEDLLPHLAAVAREGAIDITVAFEAPIAFDREGDRKRVSRIAETAVRDRLARLNGGRD